MYVLMLSYSMVVVVVVVVVLSETSGLVSDTVPSEYKQSELNEHRICASIVTKWVLICMHMHVSMPYIYDCETYIHAQFMLVCCSTAPCPAISGKKSAYNIVFCLVVGLASLGEGCDEGGCIKGGEREEDAR